MRADFIVLVGSGYPDSEFASQLVAWVKAGQTQ
jgi:hypothetical protein